MKSVSHIAAGLMAAALAPFALAETTVVEIYGTQSDTAAGCPAPEALFDRDCSYNGSDVFNTGSSWQGPQGGATSYAVGESPFALRGVGAYPIRSDVELDLPFFGTLTLEHDGATCDAGATVEVAISFYAGTLNVRGGSSSTSRLEETWADGDLTYKVAATPVTSAVPNADGGCDYEIASLGMPPVLRFYNDSDGYFPEYGSNNYRAPSPTGIVSFEDNLSQGAVATVDVGPSYSCVDSVGGPDGLCTDNLEKLAPSYRGYRKEFENLLVGFSTDAGGNVTRATAFAVNEFLIPLFELRPTNSWDAFVLNFEGSCESGCNLAPHAGPPALNTTRIFCSADALGQGAHGVAVVYPDGSIIAQRLNGIIRSRSAAPFMQPVFDAVLLSDSNSNGATELASIHDYAPEGDVTDLLSGARLSSIDFNTTDVPVDLESIADISGNGQAELALLDWNSRSVEVRESFTGQLQANVLFSSYLEARDLTILPDINNDGEIELSLLAENSGADFGKYDPPGYADKVEIRNLAGEIVRSRFLNRHWQVLAHEAIRDTNNNGSPDVAILRRHHQTGAVHVLIVDTAAAMPVLRNVPFDTNYAPEKMFALTDINGNGSDEVAVFGRHTGGKNQKAKIKDSATRKLIRSVFFDRNYVSMDVSTCGDMNDNGSEELIMLGRHETTGRVLAIIKDSRTAATIARVPIMR